MNAETHGRVHLREQPGPNVEIVGPAIERADEVLTPLALQLLGSLHRRFNARRLELLAARAARQAAFDDGALPDFAAATAEIRAAKWRIAPVPADLTDRRVEITGPVDRKMIINALNAPVQAFMADFEDSCSPTWDNIILGQVNLLDAVRRTISFQDPATSKVYRLAERTATLIVRPRGWHLPEKHVRINGDTVSGALFDFALFLANNHEALARRGTGPYFYLPKLESHLEARLWNDVFVVAQDMLGIPRGTIRATVLIETILAAFEMDEILYELREHSAGLNCGRWDYIFSFIKKFHNRPNFVLPNRAQITMDRHFLNSYVLLLIETCHRRGIHAMGGMAAQIPIKNDPAANEAALEKVRQDKLREVRAGHDGTWVAHPGLVPLAKKVFDAYMKDANQISRKLDDVRLTAADLVTVPEGDITESGLRWNIDVGLQYLAAWLKGNGCVPIYNLMEDAATCEICRTQVWQWVKHGAKLSDGRTVTPQLVRQAIAEELEKLHKQLGAERFDSSGFKTAAQIFDSMMTSVDFPEFLTLVA